MTCRADYNAIVSFCKKKRKGHDALTKSPHHLSSLLQECSNSISNEKMTLGEFVDVMHERGFGILLFLFALPMAIPLPVPPGLNLLFATPLLFLTFQLIYGAKQPWLPQKFRTKEFDKERFEDFVKKADPWLSRLSFIIRPRLGCITQGFVSNIVGIFGFLFALCVCVPIPMTNTVPSFAILLMAVGLLMRDGLAIVTGIIFGSLWIIILATIGISGLKMLLSYFGL